MTPRVVLVAPSAYPLGGVAAWLDDVVPDHLHRHGMDAQLLLLAGRTHDPQRYQCAHPAVAPARVVTCGTGTAEGRVRALFRLSRQCGAAGLALESRRLLTLAQTSVCPGAGFDLACYRAAAQVPGWRLAARLAGALGRARTVPP